MSATETTRRESHLVLRAQAGDLSALDALLATTQGWLHACLLRLLGDMHLANDVLQECFLLIYRKLRFLREPRAYRAWVYRLAARRAFQHLRRWQGRPDTPVAADMLELVPAPPPADRPDPLVASAVEEQILRLTPNIRTVIVLHYFAGMSIREVSGVLDIPDGTVKSRLAGGLAILRRQLPAEPD